MSKSISKRFALGTKLTLFDAMNLLVIKSTPRREKTLSRSTVDSGSFYRESFSKISSAGGTAPHARESEVYFARDYSFFAKPKLEQFPCRSACKPMNRIGTDRIGQVRVISPLLNLSRKSITFGETNRPTGRRIKREREKNPARRGKEGTNARSLSST